MAGESSRPQRMDIKGFDALDEECKRALCFGYLIKALREGWVTLHSVRTDDCPGVELRAGTGSLLFWLQSSGATMHLTTHLGEGLTDGQEKEAIRQGGEFFRHIQKLFQLDKRLDLPSPGAASLDNWHAGMTRH